MALTDKNLIVTPSIGSTNTDPRIDYVGASTNTGPSTITATIYSLNNGTLSFDASSGQLFSITNSLSSGSIFSVNDISGIPSIDVDANGTIQLASYGGNLGIGTTNPTSKLHVIGNTLVVGSLTASSFSGNASTATTSTNVIGGISSVAQLQVTGISTFTTGPVLIGAATSTGTASQPLQVTGGAYLSGNLGIGTTTPSYKHHVIGDGYYTSVLSSIDFRTQSLSEKTTLINGNTVGLVYNTGGGNVAICTNPTGPITLNVTGIPTDSSFDNRSITFTVVAIQTAIGYACTTVNLNGVSIALKYPGGVVNVGGTGSYDIFNFTGINTVGSASTTSNYQILSIINGNFR